MSDRTSRRIPASSAYIGAGNMTSVFSQKPKKPFEQLASIYKEELGKHGGDHKSVFAKLSEGEKKAIRERIRKQQKKRGKQRFVAILISLLLTVLLMAGLVYLLRGMFKMYSH